MTPLQQLLTPPRALRDALAAASSRTWGLAAAWLATAVVLLFVAAALAELLGEVARDELGRVLFPEGWRALATTGVDVVFASGLTALRANVSVTLGLTLVALLAFPLKEAFGRSLEADDARRRGVAPPAFDDLPLWREAMSEAGLFLLALALQVAMVCLGFSLDPTVRTLAALGSVAILGLTLAVDALSPPLFRRRLAYAAVFALIGRRPLAALTLATALWLPLAALPTVEGALVDAGAWRLVLPLLLQAVVILASIAGGALTATRLSDTLLAGALPDRPRPGLLALGVVGVAATLGLALDIGVGLARALVRKTPALHCRWAPDLTSLQLDLPDLDAVGLLSGRPVEVGLRLDVTVENPTARDLALEPLRLEIRDAGEVLAATTLAPFTLSAGHARKLPLGLTLSLSPDALLRGASPDPRRWTVALMLPLDADTTVPLLLHAPD